MFIIKLIKKTLFVENEFNLNMSTNEFREILLTKEFSEFTSSIENDVITIKSKKSLGVLTIYGIYTFSIATFVKAHSEQGKILIILNSTFRPEYLFITILFIFIVFIGLVNGLGYNVIWLLTLYFITFLWFRFVIQSQEKSLQKTIIKIFQQY